MIDLIYLFVECVDVCVVCEFGCMSVFVIGGGINGILMFCDLVLQGVDVFFVEWGDFVFGVFVVLSYMIYGGICYFENGEFCFVCEFVEECNGLFKIVLYYVKLLQMMILIYFIFFGIFFVLLWFLMYKSGKLQECGVFLIKVGFMIYDIFFCDGGMVFWYCFFGCKKLFVELFFFDLKIKYIVMYYDVLMYDFECFVFDVFQDGCFVYLGVVVLNYVEVIGCDGDKVLLCDCESGMEFVVVVDVIVNFLGLWIDFINEEFGFDSCFMGGIKGFYIVFDYLELLEVICGCEIFFEYFDGCIVFIYLFKGCVLVGIIDIDVDFCEVLVCMEEEIDYFFDLIYYVFFMIFVLCEQIVYNFFGI